MGNSSLKGNDAPHAGPGHVSSATRRLMDTFKYAYCQPWPIRIDGQWI